MTNIYIDVCCHTPNAHLKGREVTGDCFAGVYIINEDGQEHKFQAAIGIMTNPEAYINAAFIALVKAKSVGVNGEVKLNSSHDVLIGWLSGRYGIKLQTIKDISSQIKELAKEFDQVYYQVVDKKDKGITMAKILAKGQKTLSGSKPSEAV